MRQGVESVRVGGVGGTWQRGGVVWYSPGVCAHPPRLGVLPERCRGRVGGSARGGLWSALAVFSHTEWCEAGRSVVCSRGPATPPRGGVASSASLPPRSSARRGCRGVGRPVDKGGGVARPGEFEVLCPSSLTCVRAGHGAVPVVLAAWICGGDSLVRRVGLSPLAGGAEVAPTARRRRCAISPARRAQQPGAARSLGSSCGAPRWKNGASDGSDHARGPQLAGAGRRGIRGPCCVRVYLNEGEERIAPKVVISKKPIFHLCGNFKRS